MTTLPRTEGATCEILVAGIPVELTRKRVRRLSMRVSRDGQARMSVPMNCSLAAAQAFAKANEEWLVTHAARAQERLESALPSYEPGSTTHLWGVPHPVAWETVAGKRARAALGSDGTVMLRLPRELQDADDASLEARRGAIRELRRSLLKEALPEAAAHAEARTGLVANEWRTKAMVTRWGTCAIKARRVWISVDLAAHDPSRLEYVCIHELCHLREKGHGPRFQALMDQFLPGWRSVRSALNKEAPLP